MPPLLAALILLPSLDPTPTAASPALRWLNCSVLETPHGQVIVDRLAYVFFDMGSVVITPQAAEMLNRFVEQYNQPVPSPTCRVTIGGNADRVGSAEHNLALSMRRAAAVAAYLRQRGLSAPILIEGYGERRPLVETADGVPEPQNRYVVVVAGE